MESWYFLLIAIISDFKSLAERLESNQEREAQACFLLQRLPAASLFSCKPVLFARWNSNFNVRPKFRQLLTGPQSIPSVRLPACIVPYAERKGASSLNYYGSIYHAPFLEG